MSPAIPNPMQRSALPPSSTRQAARHAASAAPWGWSAIGAATGVLLTLIWFAPASWMGAVVDSASGGRVSLAEARGSVWTGSARLVLSGGAGSRDQAVLPGRLDWRLRPAWRGLTLQVQADCCTPQPLQARVALQWNGASLAVNDGKSQWPASLLAGLGTPWNTVQAEGNLQMATQALTLTWADGRMALAGRTELTATGMSSRLSTLRPMGSYRFTLTGGSAPTLELVTLEGSMQLSGTGRWVDAKFRFDGVASALPEHEAALSNLLNIIGRRNGARSIITLG